jgi:HAD superfamily hydrolase (TIGR01509 family)
MISALVFDFDGLIIDSETAISATWIELYSRHGVPFPEHLWRRMIGTREHDDLLWNHLAEQTGMSLDVEMIEPERRERGIELANLLQPLPGVVEHLEAAAAVGLRLAIASSSSAWWVNGHLERLGLDGRFSVVCTKECAPRSKPDPGVYRCAIERLGFAAGEALAFEDSQAGVEAAKSAGLQVVAVPGSFTEEMDFSAADMVVASLADIAPVALWRRFEGTE